MDAGLDLVHPFDARALDPARPHGVLIANTRALWPALLAARAADPALRDAADPIELYVERAVAAAYPGAKILYAHRTYDGAYLPFQRVAADARLGVLTPAHLVVHPIYGPWIALRAIVLTVGVPPPPAAPLSIDEADAHPPAAEAALALALVAQGPDAWRAWLAVRDACPIGRAHRYYDAQIRYHYTKDRAALL